MAKPKQYNYPRPSLRHFPSQAVLSALAAIATSPSVVAGSPLPPPTPPPDFLCPLIQRDIVYPPADTFPTPPPPPTPIPSSSASSATPAPSAQHLVIADRYVKGNDSLWRKTSAWILYGSTCCSSSTTASASTSHAPTPTSTSASTTAAFDTSALPAGWNNANSTTSSTESTTILALAIALAGSICVFILGCLVWRRRKKRARDIERKLGSDVLEKGARGKMRMWARASARWKSNIRQSVHRRRKRPLASAINQPPSPTFNNSQVSVDVSSPSHRSSFSGDEPVASPPEAALCPNDSSTSHEPPQPPSPPTYGASFGSCLPSTAAVSGSSPAPPLDRPRSTQPSNPSFVDDEPLPYIPCSDGHVAIDDKAYLARIRDLASSPPDGANQNTVQSVSAPEWHQVEDDEELGIDLSDIASRDFGFPPSFPPPPEAEISFGYLDDHPLCFGKAGDILVSCNPGPSGSLFRASPSAPPIDYPSLEPSAPPLEDEDDLFQDWEAASSYIPEVSASADQSFTPAQAADSSISSSSSFTSRTSLPPIRGSSTRISILPQYRP